MVLTQTQRVERAKVASMHLTAATNQIISLENLISIEEINEHPTKQMYTMLSTRLSQLEIQIKPWIDNMFEVIIEDDSSQMIVEVGKVNDQIQLLHVKLCNIQCKIPEATNQSTASTSHQAQGCQLKLPTLPEVQIPFFHGVDGEWERFKELFLSVIDARDDLDDLKKLTYLKGYCKDKAALTIAGINITAANYQVAWEKLKKNHENLPLVVSRLAISLINLPAMTALTAHQIQQIITQVSSIVINLEAVGLHLNPIANVLIVELVSQKLSSYLRELWQGEKPKEATSTWSELEVFLEKHRRIKQQLEEQEQQVRQIENKPRKTRNMLTQAARCVMCGQSHGLYVCEAFLQMKIVERVDFVGRSGLCFKCLETSNHMARNCQSNYGCSCRGNHHRLLHQGNPTEPHSQQTLTSVNNQLKGIPEVLLATALVKLYNKEGNSLICRAIIDTASHSSFMTKRMAKMLNLKGRDYETITTGLGGTVTASTSKLVEADVGSRFHATKHRVEFSIIPQITGMLPTKTFQTTDWKIPLNLNLADPAFSISNPVDLLLGAQVFFNTLTTGLHQIREATLLNTQFGWIIGGNAANNKNVSLLTNAGSPMTVNGDCLQEQLSKFFELDAKDELRLEGDSEIDACEQHFQQTHRRKFNGQFEVQIPLKSNPPPLGDTQKTAERQLSQLLNRLARNEELNTSYCAFMTEYEQLGHMELIQASDVQSKYGKIITYLPHHGVIKPTSSSTKTRVVFNASQKSSSGFSLNDTMMNGGVVQPNLLTIFIRFRTRIHVFCADITKMYRQILVHESQHNLQRIIWKSHPAEHIKTFRLKTVTYGTTSAPYLATRVLNQIANDGSIEFPLASDALLNNTYVDDIMGGADTITEVIELQRQLIELLHGATMKLHKWSSNTKVILHSVPAKDLEPMRSLNEMEDTVVKTLGMSWDPTRDAFIFKINLTSYTGPTTKRSALSQIASIFDPLGLLAPVILNYKLFIQNLWKQKTIGWDTPLTTEDEDKWQILRKNLAPLEQLTITRCIKPAPTSHIELHGFADASGHAYGACIYLVSKALDGTLINSSLVVAKSKVGPLEQISMPRMELLAATMLARLMSDTMRSLSLKLEASICWSDSTTVLSWIKTPSSMLKQFCANRVDMIQRLTVDSTWKYVNTKINPADIVSRGCTTNQLVNNDLWFDGPVELFSQPTELIERPVEADQVIIQAELKKTALVSLVTTSLVTSIDVLITSHSSLRKLQRSFAYVLRFTTRARNRTSCTSVKQLKIQLDQIDPLTVTELHDALIFLTKHVQSREFPDTIKILKAGKPLKNDNLCLFLDDHEMLRVGGRLHHLQDSSLDTRHPMLLPKNHHFSRLVAYTMHRESFHCGQQALLAIIRQSFWPLNGKQLVKSVIHSCVLCFRLKPTLEIQRMGNLPTTRIHGSHPFAVTGVDFGGPFMIRDGHGRTNKTKKTYIAVFVCFATKAIHVELVNLLTTVDFIAALKRFFSRRGQSQELHSDNATNFKGADAASTKLVEQFNAQQSQAMLTTFCASRGTTWKFIPPRSPHFGGLWEAAIKSVKFHMKREIGNTILTYEELNTLVIQIEGILNSRPLLELSTDSNDLSALTPAHFLIGRPLTEMPEPNVVDIQENRLGRWQRIQALYQRIWKRWCTEYLTSLQPRHKWYGTPKFFKLNQLVLIKEENIPPLNWKLGRLIKLHQGSDGLVRVVSIKTQTGIIDRAITRICVLPIEDNN